MSGLVNKDKNKNKQRNYEDGLLKTLVENVAIRYFRSMGKGKCLN